MTSSPRNYEAPIMQFSLANFTASFLTFSTHCSWAHSALMWSMKLYTHVLKTKADSIFTYYFIFSNPSLISIHDHICLSFDAIHWQTERRGKSGFSQILAWRPIMTTHDSWVPSVQPGKHWDTLNRPLQLSSTPLNSYSKFTFDGVFILKKRH